MIKSLPEDIIRELEDIVGPEHVLTSFEERYCYSFDASIHSLIHRTLPDVVIRPSSTDEVSSIVKLANREKIPITPRGAGTNVTGGAIPLHGGIVIDMARMNKIIEIDKTNLRCTVEAGVVHTDLENELAKHGLFWPPDPASGDSCTIGGCLAENAGGMRAFKYGTTREWVLGLEVVLPTGEVIKTGTPTLKGVTGLDLTRLFVGSEGTLGIITKALLKPRPLPEAVVRLSAFFNKVEDVGIAVKRITEAGIMPLTIEFLDRDIIRMVNDWLKLGLPEAEAMMIIDLDGTREQVERLSKDVEKILKEVGASSVQKATTAEEMANLYLARKSAYPSIFRLGKGSMMGDICVPISKLIDAFRSVKQIAKKHDVYVAIFGHIGDGNLHPLFSVDLRDPNEIQKILSCYDEIMKMALRLGGSVTAEHGVGASKLKLLEEECGTEAVKVMRMIKKALDPNNIMNPGKWI